MSGLEILGAVAASLQLADLCVQIGTRLCQLCLFRLRPHYRDLWRLRSPPSEINRSMLDLSPRSRSAVQQLAAHVQIIRYKIERHRKIKAVFKLIIAFPRTGMEHRKQLMFAMEKYQTSATLIGHTTLTEILDGQKDLAQQLKRVVDPIKEMLNKLDGDIRETREALRMEIENQHSWKQQQVQISTIVREVLSTTIRDQPASIREGLGQFIVTNAQPRIQRMINVDYPTLSDYFSRIWDSASSTTDQDIWEAFHA